MLLIVLSKLKCSVIHIFIETYGRWFNAHFLKKPMVWLNVEWNVQRVWPLLSSWSYLKGVKLEVHRRVGNEPGACYAFPLSLCLLAQRHSIPKYFSEVTEYFHSSCYLPGLGHHIPLCSHLPSQVLINQLSYNSKNNNALLHGVCQFPICIFSHHGLFQATDSLATASWQNSWIFSNWLPCASVSWLKPSTDSMPCSTQPVICQHLT